jgi:predicted component of type VI protein secretion system
VSRYHCALVSTPVGVWAVDLLGRGGIALNGATARAARLDAGDELRVGSFVLRTASDPRPDDGAPPPAADEPAAGPPPAPALPLLPAAEAALAPAPAERPVTTGPWLLPAAADEALSPLVLHLTRAQQQMAEQFHMTMTGMMASFREMHRDQMRILCQELVRVQQLTEELTALRAEMARLSESERDAPPPADAPAPPAAAPSNEPAAPAPAAAGAAPPFPPPRPPADPGRPVLPKGLEHEWLSRRLAEVQQEREGRWQKILSFLGGKQ